MSMRYATLKTAAILLTVSDYLMICCLFFTTQNS